MKLECHVKPARLTLTSRFPDNTTPTRCLSIHLIGVHNSGVTSFAGARSPTRISLSSIILWLVEADGTPHRPQTWRKDRVTDLSGPRAARRWVCEPQWDQPLTGKQ